MLACSAIVAKSGASSESYFPPISGLAQKTMSEAVGEFLTHLCRRVARDVLVELAPGV
jgi:hypothetical protein